MNTYPRIPEFPDPEAPETVYERGARCLRWILETNVVVTIADVDLERADIAAAGVVGARDASPVLLERISAVRHYIAWTLAERRRCARNQRLTAGTTQQTKPNLGPMAPLSTPPDDFPPAPSAARRPVAVDVGF